MKEVILCKYGELILKGANRQNFESMLVKECRRRASVHGVFRIYYLQSTVYIEPQNDECDIDGMFETARRIFGFVAVGRAAVCEKSMESIEKTVREYIGDKLDNVKTFKIEAKRSDKRFPLKSPEIAREIGGVVLSMIPRLKVDVHNPDAEITVEVRDENAYVRVGQLPGAGGLPLRSSGRGLLLLSGGIDSPVAGLMMAKRGLDIEALHFESFPYTSERAKEKVLTLAEEMCEYTSRIHVHIISLTHIQEVLRDCCDEDSFTVLLRVFMMRLAERCAKAYQCECLITGESLGQVASQTMSAITVTDSYASLPVFRPCIGMDKEEIVKESRKYGTFETSILPYEDCCTVFTPAHPKTKPKREDIEKELEKVDFEGLLDEAYATMYTVTKKVFENYR